LQEFWAIALYLVLMHSMLAPVMSMLLFMQNNLSLTLLITANSTCWRQDNRLPAHGQCYVSVIICHGMLVNKMLTESLLW